jgi:hypothetical protein
MGQTTTLRSYPRFGAPFGCLDDEHFGDSTGRAATTTLTCVLLSGRGEDLNLPPSGYETWGDRLPDNSGLDAVVLNQ